MPMVDGSMEKGVEVRVVMDSAMVYVYVLCVCLVCRMMYSVEGEHEQRSLQSKSIRRPKPSKTNLKVGMVAVTTLISPIY